MTGLHIERVYTSLGTSTSSHNVYTTFVDKNVYKYAWAGGKEFGVRIGWRKYLYECSLLGM